MKRNISNIFLILCISLLIVAQKEYAQKTSDSDSNLFVDTLDNSVDISEFMRTRYGFAFIPTIITEPAIGYGGGGGLVFIHRDPKDISAGKGNYPSLSALGGFYTQSKSWAIGGGHFGVWKNGAIRYRGGAGYVSANLNYYREPAFQNGAERIGFNITAYGIIQEIIFRLGLSDFFAGASYSFGHTKVLFDKPDNIPEEIDLGELSANIGGFGTNLYFDSRDNMFTPNYGIYSGVNFVYYDKFLGSDRRFQKLHIFGLGYTKLVKNLFAGMRVDLRTSFQDVPFYLRPFIALRGVPALRYQGKTTYLAETELRWDFTSRWSLVGFGGYGEAIPVNENLFDKQTAFNFGGGFRYLIARLYGLRMGIDIARGPEDWAFYIQFGSSWFRY